MRMFGLIGYPLEHSFSSAYFADKFEHEGIVDAVYMNYPLEDISELREFLLENPLDGFNVTIPHKEAIIPLLDELSPTAKEIGAVNCVVRRGKKLIGYNTDNYGFRESLLSMIGEDRPSALVLGSGGASKAVAHVLKKLGMNYNIVSTHPEKGDYLSYDELGEKHISVHRLIINTTPLGTFPNVAGKPSIPYEYITPSHYLYDMVYNPPITRFIAQGQERGAHTRNGYRMLTLQAEKAWELFCGQEV